MKHHFALGTAALLLAPALAATAYAQPARSSVDWAAQVERTPEGGYRMGNPAAALKLVEYGSVTCSHCADFEEVAGDEIRDHVRSGRVSFEYRPFIIFPSDPGLFLLLGCQAPDRFFSTVRQLYATQATWTARLEAEEANIQAELARSPNAYLPAYLRASGNDRLFRDNGMTDQDIASCLANQAGIQRLQAAHRQGQAAGVQGTPTFYLNGEKLEVASWAQILVRLRQP